MTEVDPGHIAVVGYAGRFPRAPDAEAFWRNLAEGREAITFFTPEELRAAGVPEALLSDPHYVAAKGVLEEADCFDAAYFGITPREAAAMDPQHRVFLEAAAHALQHAGHDAEDGRLSIGLFGSTSLNTYWISALAADPQRLAGGGFDTVVTVDKDFLCTRAAYLLDLRGPAVSVQTACSSSLVAVHLACQSLIAGECDLALAGGVSVSVPLAAGYRWQEGAITSPDGHCRAFSAHAAGTLGGNGVGLVALRRLEDALAEGDRIHAVIRGSAVANDGRARAGYGAPGVDGQARVVRAAQAVAGVEPAGIGYLEAHGTGTPVGDPIEVSALKQAFAGAPAGSCLLGSIKSNIGHLDAAAGIAGLLKAVLALEREAIPPTLHAERPNPALGLTDSPFRLAQALTPWPRGGRPRRAGVSSFGMGGTNAHVVLEEAPSAPPVQGSERSHHLLLLSARSRSALDRLSAALAERLRDQRPPLAAVAWTLQAGRRALEHRRALVVVDLEEAVATLESDTGRAVAPPRAADLLFHCPEGPLDAEALQRLQEREPAFRRVLEDLGGPAVLRAGGDLVALVALGRLWRAWGLAPAGVTGGGVGARAAAVLRGDLELEAALAGAPLPPEPPVAKEAVVLDVAAALDPRRVMEVLGTLWQAGAAPDWLAVHQGFRQQRIPLPLYPFERSRHWIEAALRADGLYTAVPGWRRAPLAEDAASAGRRWLLLLDESGVGAALADWLDAKGERVACISQGDAGDFRASFTDAALPEPPDVVVHLGLVDPVADLGAGLQRGFHSIAALAAAWPAGRSAQVVVVTRGAEAVAGETAPDPNKATVLGAALCLPQEVPGLSLRTLDVEDAPPEALAAAIAAETSGDEPFRRVALRGGRRWCATWEAAEPEAPAEPLPPGVAVVTGGLGGVGLALAEELGAAGWRLLLIGRRGVPADDETRRRLEALRAKTTVETVACNVTDRAALATTIAGARSRLGPITLAIHAAATNRGGILSGRDPREVEEEIAVKAQGAVNLLAATADDPLRRLLLCSSLTATVGGAGQSAYAAANAWLEAFAEAQGRQGDRRVVAVSWDRWRGTGMARAAEELARNRLGRPLAGGLEPRVALDAAARILAAPPDRRVAVVGGAAALVYRAQRDTPAPAATAAVQRHPRPPLAAPPVAPRDGVEAALLAAWEEIFGLSGLGVEDDFWELGGDSLVSLQLMPRIRAQLGVELPMDLPFDSPTVATMAEAARTAAAAGAASDETFEEGAI